MDVLAPDVFESPALGILCQLETEGFRLELMANGAISIAPRSRLTPERMQAIEACSDAVRVLVRCCDAGVADRRDLFRAQLDVAPPGRLPAFVFKPDIAYTAGACFSCGDPLPVATSGRCWRCSLAWRLAVRVPIPAALADAFDAAKVLA